MGAKGSSDEARGNSAILSIRGALTDTSGESSRSRMLMVRLLGIPYVGSGRDALRAVRALLFRGVLEDSCTGGNKFNEYQIYAHFNIHKNKTGSRVIKMQTHAEAKH
jgi:hypothetical protein